MAIDGGLFTRGNVLWTHKRIDAIAVVRQIRDSHYQRLQGKTHKERIAFYRERAQKMQDKVPALIAGRVSALAPKVQPNVS
jgi:hypothetical protein